MMQMHYLVGAASITFKFIIRAQRLGGGEVSETVCHTRVLRNKVIQVNNITPVMRLYLVNVDTEVTELLVLAGDCLTVETPCLARENSLGWG